MGGREWGTDPNQSPVLEGCKGEGPGEVIRQRWERVRARRGEREVDR